MPWRDRFREFAADVHPSMWLGVIAFLFALLWLLIDWLCPGLLPRL